MPTTPTKTTQTALLAWQDVASAAQVIGTALAVGSIWAAAVAIRLGRATGSAFTAGWPNVRIEASPLTSGGNWIPIFSYQMALGSSIANTTLSASASAGAGTISVTSATNIAVGDILFLGDSSASNYELVRVKGVSGTTITLEENLLNSHANGALVTDQAEMVFPQLDLSAYQRVRAVCDNANSGQGIKVEVQIVTFDSF